MCGYRYNISIGDGGRTNSNGYLLDLTMLEAILEELDLKIILYTTIQFYPQPKIQLIIMLHSII